jgi:flagellar biosynthesis protein FlhB
MADAQGDKTEKPSAKRLREARERGQIARSRDLAVAASSLAATATLGFVGPPGIRRMGDGLVGALVRIGQPPGHDLRPEDVTGLVTSQAPLLLLIVGPIALTAVAVGVMTAFAQGGVTFAPAALRLNWERLSPANGLKRLGPRQSWIDTFKAIVTASALVALALQIGRALATESAAFPWMSPSMASGRGWASIERLLWQSGFALLAISVADYGLQRWRVWSDLKMTKQEVRDESHSSEGSPEIRARVRRVQRDMTRRRMLHAAARATVVITNPTHYAVALEYRREKSPAPVVVAKGRDLIALRIREIARTHGVPIVENPPLARALHDGAEVGETIPAALFGAVAEVLAYLIRIKQLMF